MLCKKCEKEIPDGAIWCPWCGKKQIAEKKNTRRCNGTGSVYKRGDTWVCAISVGQYDSGNYKRRKKGGFRTKKEALEYIETLKYKPQRDKKLSAVYDAIQPHIDGLSKDKQSHYKTAWKRLQPLHNVNIGLLSIADLQDAMDHAVGSYYPAKDIRDLLSLIYERAIKEEYVTVNKARHLVLPDLDEKGTEPFTADEMRAMWEDFQHGHTETGFFLLMCYTGMMPGELRRLTVDMIDLGARRIVGAGIKTEKRKETPILLPDVILPVVSALISGREGNERIYPCDETAFYFDFAAMKKRTGCRPIKELRPYSCRHTLATTLADANVSTAIIKEVMRHAKISSTQKYMHPDQSLYAGAVNAALTSAAIE